MDKMKVSLSTEPLGSTAEIIEYAKSVESYADFLHCDIMDGVLTEKSTYFYNTLKDIYDNTTLVLDVHLMIANPHKYIKKFIKAGANIVTVQFEAYNNLKLLEKDLKAIKAESRLCGLCIGVDTDVNAVVPFLSYVDVVLVMAVMIGKSGQVLSDSVYRKVKILDSIKKQYNCNFMIEVDGGVNECNVAKLKQNGANCVVSGSYVISSQDKKVAINSLQI